jgi:DNA-binding MarR family transcriptional regulator
MTDRSDDVLISVRRFLCATSIHSSKLRRSVGLSSALLLVLQTAKEQKRPTASEIAKTVSLSQATITTILTELEKRGLLLRERSETDRRRVHVSLTKSGQEVLRSAPKPLQDRFATRFTALHSWEQHQILSVLEHVAVMMDADELDAAPLLSEGVELS